jgi:hypothetical protein
MHAPFCTLISNTFGTTRLRVSSGPKGGGNTEIELDVAKSSGPNSKRGRPIALANTARTLRIVAALGVVRRAGVAVLLVAQLAVNIPTKTVHSAKLSRLMETVTDSRHRATSSCRGLFQTRWGVVREWPVRR